MREATQRDAAFQESPTAGIGQRLFLHRLSPETDHTGSVTEEALLS
jgi:hypothetical protein